MAKKASRWRRLRRPLLIALAVLLLGPAILLLMYRVVPVPVTPLMLIRVVEGHGIDRDWVPLEAMAKTLPQAVVAAEDNLFCQHSGFDVKALRAQVKSALEGDRARGASTISMQTAKNLFLWPGRNFLRKGLEAWLTPYVEVILPKRRILEIYLNIVEWGPGIYGAEAAAQAHFGVPAAQLSTAQASLLAAVLPNPLEWSPSDPSGAIRQRAATYRTRINQLGPDLLGCW